MVYQVLARKWRPKTFNEVIGQDHISKTLQNSVLHQKIAHAYLFTGTRGVGKTTIARIFAKAIRCENLDDKGNPCLACSSCKSVDQVNALDYVEIDGASNNSVDNIRELIENAQYLPASGKFKVYVVDEVHMLSTSAFNALLKTLEEPPAHVIFIFATTDPHKLLGTVLSRCQRFDFKHVSQELLVQQIKKIASLENISFDREESIKILARQGNGSVRDTLSLMDQALSLSAGQELSEEVVLQSLGLARANAIKELTRALLAQDSEEVLKVYDEISKDSVEMEKFSNQILDQIFLIIENVDDEAALENLIGDQDLVSNMEIAEAMWVYETLLKDFEWGLQSFDPLRALRFALLKVAKRDEIVGQANAGLKKKSNNVKQKSESVALSPPLKEPLKKPMIEARKNVQESENKSWRGFLKALYESSRGLAMNLERARLTGEVTVGQKNIALAFTEEDKIFYDFLTEPEIWKQLNSKLKEYFEVEEMEVVFNFIDNETKERENLYSQVELEENKISKIKKNKETQIRENRYIKEAESLFSGKISKIILKEDGE